MKQHEKFQKNSKDILGDSWQSQEFTSKILEEFTCTIYRSKEKSGNQLREEMFTKKYQNEKKTLDLSVFARSRSLLKVYWKRSNYVAKV